jgi:hypothetical protein
LSFAFSQTTLPKQQKKVSIMDRRSAAYHNVELTIWRNNELGYYVEVISVNQDIVSYTHEEGDGLGRQTVKNFLTTFHRCKYEEDVLHLRKQGRDMVHLCPDLDGSVTHRNTHSFRKCNCDHKLRAHLSRQSAPPVNSLWVHKKTKVTYLITHYVIIEKTMDLGVVYRSNDGYYWVRPLWEFTDGRFTPK